MKNVPTPHGSKVLPQRDYFVDFLKNARFLARTKTILLLRTGSGNCVMAGGMHSSVSLFFPPKD
jgi:hypothetical protein